MRIFRFLCLIILLFGGQFAFSQPSTEKVSVYGKVVDSRTKKPITNVPIKYILGNNIIDLQETTDAVGFFEVHNFPIIENNNAIQLIVRADGYEPKLTLSRIVDRIIPDIELVPNRKTINGQVRNYRTGTLMSNIEIAFLDKSFKEQKEVTDSKGRYQITTLDMSGERFDIKVSSDIHEFYNLEHSLILPESGDFQEIQILLPKNKRGWKIGLSIGAVAGLGLGLTGKILSDRAYNKYKADSSTGRQDFYNEANHWNRTAIISTALGCASAVGLSFVIGNKKGQKTTPKIF